MKFLSLIVTTLLVCNVGSAKEASTCPFTTKELKSAFGVDFKEGKKGFESNFGTGKSLDCRYESKNMTLMVKQTVMNDPSQTQGWDRGFAGKSEKIAKDPDGALQQIDQGDNTNPNLHYARSGDIVELRFMGVGKKNPLFAELNKKLVGLRRLP